MNAFESVIATLLQREGYWVIPNYKVNLTKEEKLKIGRPKAPRWEVDLIAYKGASHELIAVECKSYLDSGGVYFKDGKLLPPSLYKLFEEPILREVILTNLVEQLIAAESCHKNTRVYLALATGKISRRTDKESMSAHFKSQGWLLYDDKWVQERLCELQNAGYENEVAYVAAKLALRERL